MYVTRPHSMYKRDPAALSHPPPLGPNSGYLVILDEEAQTYSCFCFKESSIRHLPFPQNRNLTINNPKDDYGEEVLLIPVLNHPLSSNCYYVIRRQGKHQGLAITSTKITAKLYPKKTRSQQKKKKNITSSKEEDVQSLFCTFIEDAKPEPLDPFNDYQQFEITKDKEYHCFHAKCIATDGIPPRFLRRKGWMVDAKTPENYHLDEALGSNDSLRAQLPDFNFPLSNDRSKSVVVGKWYCPFMFVKEGMRLKDQMRMSMFYEVTLQQRWEKIFSKENINSREKVFVDVVIQVEVAKVAGRDAVWDENGVVDGVLWFKSYDDEGAEKSVGLSLDVVERMKWEQERVGWIAGNERQVRVERVEEFGGKNKWKEFSCYVLVESFVLQRMGGRLALTYEYKHTQQIRCKWE